MVETIFSGVSIGNRRNRNSQMIYRYDDNAAGRPFASVID